MGAVLNGLDTGNGGAGSYTAWAITRFNNELYVGGWFNSLGNTKAALIGKWNGISWDSIPVQPFKKNEQNCIVYALEVINNELYMGGIFDTVAGIPMQSIAKWNGSNWTDLNFHLQNPGQAIGSIAYYKSEIYVGGNFLDQGLNDGRMDILRYDGISWKTVGGGIYGGSSFVQCMVEYKNELYVGGYFYKSDGNAGNFIQKWDGNNWSDVGGGVYGDTNLWNGNGQIRSLLVHNNELYAMGTFISAGGIPADKVAKWDGTNWCGFGSDFNNNINAGCFFRDTLYVGGGFTTIDTDSINLIAKWIGGNYTDTCGNLTGIENTHNKSALNIYPNPNNGLLTIEAAFEKSEEINIMLYNVIGELVLKIEEGIVNGSYKKQLSIEKFPAGVYFLSIQTSSENLQLKVVKQ